MEATLLNQLESTFNQVFQEKGHRLFFSPGRVNLIGEHTDYNGGHVFPCAITNGTYGLVTPRQDRQVHVYSMNFEEAGLINFDLDQLDYKKEDSWANYVKGMLLYIQEAGHRLTNGFNLLVYGIIPNGAGLSSSASLEMLIGVMADQLFDLQMDRLEIVKLGKKVENQFMGVNSGIMDQFAVAMGQENAALYLDTNTLEYECVPAEFGDYKILIMNTNKRRELADSKYNTRRGECEEALARLQKELDIESLGQLSEETFETNRHLIGNAILEARAKHAVYENVRTNKAVDSLKAGDIVAFGQLMNQSHTSLQEDYDVTGLELDTLVHKAWTYDQVLGARMTGAGMGGCAIALVEASAIEKVMAGIKEEYVKVVGYEPSFYVAQVGPGTKELSYGA